MDITALRELRDEGNALFQTLHDEGAHDDADRRAPFTADPDSPRVHEWATRVADVLDDLGARTRLFARAIAANPHVDRSKAQHELWDRLTQLNRIIEEA